MSPAIPLFDCELLGVITVLFPCELTLVAAAILLSAAAALFSLSLFSSS